MHTQEHDTNFIDAMVVVTTTLAFFTPVIIEVIAYFYFD